MEADSRSEEDAEWRGARREAPAGYHPDLPMIDATCDFPPRTRYPIYIVYLYDNVGREMRTKTVEESVSKYTCIDVCESCLADKP